MKAIITTRLPPATCGIGSYSALLREHWPESTAPVAFLVMDGAAAARHASSDEVAEFHGSGSELGRQLDWLGTGDLLLHYAGRAYQRFGCPLWLPGVLARWKRKFPGSRLMIMAHEVPGRLPMASRHFWLAQVNACIIRRLARIADVLVTNTPHHAAQLSRISGRSDVQLLPVGSNISGSSHPAPERSAT
ncbi:MAG: glycosyltransferase, partial [Verrucomicrobiota bacterium]|nr:glycosyltransferase [Verrucomicrobiota bacterium]